MNSRAFAIAAFAGLVAAVPVAASAQIQQNTGYDINATPAYTATKDEDTIQSIAGNSFTLNDGTTVNVDDSTAMTSPVSELAPGMTVVVVGRRDGPKSIKAAAVRVKSGFNPSMLLGGA